MRASFMLGEARHEVGLARAASGYRLLIGADELPLSVLAEAAGSLHFTLAGRQVACRYAVAGDTVFLHIGGETVELVWRDPVGVHAAASGAAAGDTVRAPMPGAVVALPVAPGDAVSAGDTVAIIESMKMEVALRAPRDGVVAALHAAVGQAFDRDAVLVSLETVA